MGALLYVVIANRGRLGQLSGRGMIFMVVLSLYFGLTSSGVDNMAHIGGSYADSFCCYFIQTEKNTL